jgi:uncharacterized protein YfaS (alpha-2-macroglobulin family)
MGQEEEGGAKVDQLKSLGYVAKKSKDERDDASNRAPASPPGAGPGETALRSNFAETAFWAPQLLTGPDGSATIEFTVPDSVTSWNVWVHAVTRDLRGGSLRKETKSVKELMVRPYLPRFLREGDEAVIAVVVNDSGERAMKGSVELDVLDPATQRSLASEFGLASGNRSFEVKAGGGTDGDLRSARRPASVRSPSGSSPARGHERR